MSADTGVSYRSCSNGRAYWHGAPWKPVEILAMVLGFMVFWPVGPLSWVGNSGRGNPVTPATSFASGEKNGKNGRSGRMVPAAGVLPQIIGQPPVLAWARRETALSMNGAPPNSRD